MFPTNLNSYLKQHKKKGQQAFRPTTVNDYKRVFNNIQVRFLYYLDYD